MTQFNPDKHDVPAMEKMVVLDFKKRSYNLEFRDRHSLKVFMNFLKANEYRFFVRGEKGEISPAEVEVR